MARIRTIKPEFWTDEHVVEMTAWARLLFIGLWNFADDDGRMVYSPKRIKMQIFPGDDVDIVSLFAELRREERVVTYCVDGVEYLAIINFARHQKVDKRSASKIPEPPPIPPNSPEEPQLPPTDQGREWIKDQGRELVEAAASVSPPTKKLGARLPANWTLPLDWQQWAETRRPDIDPFLEGEKFANFWWAKAGRDGTKLDWEATWRNWILNAKVSGNAQRPDTQTSFTEIAARVAARKAAAGVG